MTTLAVRCPAKVNLGLSVLGRRADGFHEIVTLFQAIDLWDELSVRESDTLSIDVTDPGIPAGADNLVLRAAQRLRDRVPAARGRGAAFRLVKGIPAAAGLGGGSSDAAGALLLLDRLWRLALDRAALAEIGSEIGSDVPYFFHGGTALGTGRGERIRPLAPIPQRVLLMGFPPFGLRTSEVYAALHAPLTGEDSNVTVPRLFVKLAEGNDFALARNDLEKAAIGLSSEIGVFREAVAGTGAEVALLSGSGSTVFGIYREGTDVSAIADSLRRSFPAWRLRETRTIASGLAWESSGA